jgi:subtilase family serine protease
MIVEHHEGTVFTGNGGFVMSRKRTRATVLAATLTAAGLAVAMAGAATTAAGAAAAGTAAAGTIAAGTGTAGTGTAQASTTAHGDAAASISVRPDVVRLGKAAAQVPFTDSQCEAVFHVDCYLPTQVEAAYNLPALYSKGITGKGTTIVIVDAYGSPTISDDLAQFDDYIGLGSPPFQIIKQGNVPAYDSSNSNMFDWAAETTLDVEYAHASAPGAKIILVEAPSSDPYDYFAAVDYAITHRLGQVISMSYAVPEPDLGWNVHLWDSVFAAAGKAHITLIGASGDQGASGYTNSLGYFTHPVVEFPTSNPLVTAVGGTQLNINASGQRGGPDAAWNDTYNKPANDFYFQNDGPNPLASGGGKSAYYGRPSYQNSVKNITGSQRGIPDISMSASCTSAVNVYQTFAGVQGGWYPACGTSEATPMFAGVVDLAVQQAGHALGPINPALYKLAAENAPGIVAISGGNNTVSFGGRTVHGYTVRHGYNLVTGLGTINGQYFVPELARLG